MATITATQKHFENLVKADALSHAYLFYGFENWSPTPHSEKRVLAHSIARFLETKKWVGEAPLSEVRVLSGDIGIDEIREAKEFLWRAPVLSSRRTIIISAEALTAQAGQALLKITEEPPVHALIILLASHSEVLLSTLASRVQKLFISSSPESPLPKELIAQARDFFAATSKERKDMLKKILEEEKEGELVVGIMHELKKDMRKNSGALKRLLERLVFMGRYSTNRKLQLEAALLTI